MGTEIRDSKAENSIRKRNAAIAVFVSVFFIAIILVYFSMLQNERRQNMVKDGALVAKESAEQIDRYLSTNIDSVKLAAYALDEMIKEHRTDAEIQEYLTAQSTAFKNTVLENSTGLYGYINGRFFSGTNWIPPSDYVATEPPWYTRPFDTPGEITLLDPYVDVQSGNVMLSLGKTLSDGENVVSVDVSLDRIQTLTEEAVRSGDSDIEMILNEKGTAVAHSDREEVGLSYPEEEGTMGALITEKIRSGAGGWFEFDLNGSHYIAYVAPIQNGWNCVSVIDATHDFSSLKKILIGTIVLVIVTILMVSVIMTRSNRYLRMSVRAMAANEAKTAFLSNMSHEIRTPINAILGMNETILRQAEDPSVRYCAEYIKNAGRTLLRMINDILDYSLIEAGKIEIIPDDYDLSLLVNDLAALIHSKADDKGLFFIMDIDPGTPLHLVGDEMRLRQIITNLLTNAVKYTEKGRVTLKIGYEKVPEDPESILLHVSVRDTGIGIKEEDMPKLFRRFERLEEERNRSIEGTGLGLNISESLLKKMGSALTVQSVYGEGSLFGFSLLQKVRDWEGIGDAEASFREFLSSKKDYQVRFTAPEARILVVDDNPMNLIVFQSLVRDTMVQVETAESGEEGLGLMEKEKYDLIFLDHMMPVKDGIETLHELRVSPGNPNGKTPVICLTANAVTGAKEEYLSAGFDEYLTKPVEPARLEEIMIRFLPGEKVGYTAPAGEVQGEKPEEDLPRELSALRGTRIDAAAGLKSSGNLQTYLTLLKVFGDSIEEKAEELNRFLDEGDLKNYAIKVHALKSSARVIGAGAFGERAQELEDAGKRGDEGYIQDRHPEFIHDLLEFKEPISRLFDGAEEADPDRPEADAYMMEKAYEDIRAAAEDFDCDILIAIFSEMADYAIPAGDAALWEKLKAASDRYDYSGILSLLDDAQEFPPEAV